MRHHGTLLGAAVVFVAAAVASAAGAPLAERLGQAWRWRELHPPGGAHERRFLTQTPQGDLLALAGSRLVRYDGYFWREVAGGGDAASVHPARVFPHRGGLVLSGGTGLSFLDPRGELRLLQEVESWPQVPFCRTPDGRLLVAFGRTIARIEPDRLVPLLSLPEGAQLCHGLEADAEGRLWCSTDRGVYRYDGRWSHLPLPAGVPEPSWFSFVLAEGDAVWFFPGLTDDQDQVVRWRDGKLAKANPRGRGFYARHVVRVPGGGLLAAPNTGGWLLRRGGRWLEVRTPAAIDEDVRTLLWVGPNRLVVKGVSGHVWVCDLGANRWEAHLPAEETEGCVVNALCPARAGGLWVATNLAVYRWDGARFVAKYTEAAGVSLRVVTALCEDARGDLWLGSGSSFVGALRFDGERWHRHQEPDGVGDFCVHAIRPGAAGEVWFLLLGQGPRLTPPFGGVARLRAGEWTRFTTAQGLPHDRAYDLVRTATGKTYVGTLTGVAVRQGEAWRPLPEAAGWKGWALHAAPDHSLWVARGLGSPGVRRLVPGQPAAEPTEFQASLTVAAFAPANGHLWVSSPAGLMRYDGEQWHEPTREPGVPARNFWPIVAEADGDVWLGSQGHGLVRHRPDDKVAPRTARIDVHLDERMDRAMARWEGADHWNATPADLLRFRWRVDGGPWSAPIEEPELRLPDLESGSHRLEVQAIDVAGNYEPEPVAYGFEIPRPLLARPALYLPLGVIVAVLGVVGALALRQRRFRHQAEARERAALEEAEQHLARLRTVIDHGPVVLFAVDRDGVFTLSEGRGLAALGLAAGEVVGRSAFEMYRDEPRITTCLRRALGGEEVGETAQAGGRYWETHYAPLRDRAGEVGGVIGVAVDTTERQVAEEARRRTEQHLRAIVEHTNELVYLRSLPEGTLLFVSPSCERLTGYTPEEYVRLASEIVLHDHPASEDVAATWAGIRSGALDSIAPYTRAIRHKNGQVRIHQVHENYAVHEGARVLMGIAVDVTEIREAQEAMQHSEKLTSLGILAGGIAHDFNNLLVGVLGNARLAATSLTPTAPARTYLEEVETAAQRAADLCRQMLAYAGKAQFRVEVFDLSGLVAEMTELVRASIPKTVTVQVLLARELPPVEGDPAQIRQVVMNLLTNASEAIGADAGDIIVSSGVMEADGEYLRATEAGEHLKRGRYVFVEVTDTGCGMDPATRARLFEPFFTTKFEGRGLGLAGVLGIVRGHRGGLHVASALGRGTTVRLLLPCAALPVTPAAPEPLVSAPGEAPETILVVDDEDLVRDVSCGLLEAAGHRVLGAAHGAEAIQILHDHGAEVDGVLLDMTMPGLSVEETFAALREMRPGLPVILTSGYEQSEVLDRLTRHEATAFVHKPFTPEQLTSALHHLMRGGQREPA
ncbi:MAG: PAS domain S-box protein [Planctomycetota bacterium]